MPGRKSRRSSKRVTPKTRQIIKKKKKAFAKKARKQSRELRALGIVKKKKKTDLRIPNLCPFKEQLLRQAVKGRAELKKELEDKRRLKKLRKEMVRRGLETGEEERKLGFAPPKSLLKTAFYNQQDVLLPNNPKDHRRMYFRELNRVIEQSDVVVEVLDARDPLGCRNEEIERRVARGNSAILGGRKKVVLLLNKIDLVPWDVLQSWVALLRREHPVVAFKASTQTQKRKGHSRMRWNQVTLDNNRSSRSVTGECVGADTLLKLLKNYCRTLDLKAPITVGFIGYPNTGKSSVINSLKRAQAVGTASMPGFTTHLQTVRLDSNLTLIDSPGVILNEEVEARLVLRNAVKLQDVDPMESAEVVLQCVDPLRLAKLYGVDPQALRRDAALLQEQEDGADHLSDGERVLFALSKQLQHLKAGGVPDLARTAKLVVSDWHHGKIAYYVPPPDVVETDTSVAYVQEFAPEFDVDALLKSNAEQAVGMVKRYMDQDREFLPVNPDRFEIGRRDGEEASDSVTHSGDEDQKWDADMADFNRGVEMVNQLGELEALASKKPQPDLSYLQDKSAELQGGLDVDMKDI